MVVEVEWPIRRRRAPGGAAELELPPHMHPNLTRHLSTEIVYLNALRSCKPVILH